MLPPQNTRKTRHLWPVANAPRKNRNFSPKFFQGEREGPKVSPNPHVQPSTQQYLNDQDLLHSLRNGDQQAFRQLVETWQNMVYNTVLGIVQDLQEAEDVSQEVFVQVWRSVKDFRGEAKLSTWLYRIAVTKALDAERKKKARKRAAGLKHWLGFGGEGAPEPVHFDHPGVRAENREKASVLFKAMQGLAENQRIAFTLIKAEGLSYEETAAIMNISVKAVEALMHRAKENLRKKLSEYHKA